MPRLCFRKFIYILNYTVSYFCSYMLMHLIIKKNLMRKILTYSDFHFIEDNGWGLETLNNIALLHSTQVHIIPNLGLQYDIYGSRTPLFFFPWMSVFPSCCLSLFCHFYQWILEMINVMSFTASPTTEDT